MHYMLILLKMSLTVSGDLDTILTPYDKKKLPLRFAETYKLMVIDGCHIPMTHNVLQRRKLEFGWLIRMGDKNCSLGKKNSAKKHVQAHVFLRTICSQCDMQHM